MSEEITMVSIGGMKIGLIGLAEIFATLRQMNLSDESELKNQMLEQVRIQNYVPDSRAEDYAQTLLREYKKFAGLPVETVVEKTAFPTIRILGPGCAACENMERDVRAILSELNIAADVDHIRESKKLLSTGWCGCLRL